GEDQWALVLESVEAAAGLEGPAVVSAPASGDSAAAPASGVSAAAPGGPAASGVLALSLESEDGQVRPFDVTVHRVAELLVLEFEPRAADGPFVFQNFYPRVRRALHRLQGAADVTECCAAAVREVQALTGYDRVVAYRFDGAD
ncbi:histidine kinase, partial [Streptomyces sp. SID8455]|nr:histidine kinase [Streptomyces sp. SID8455]